MADLNIDILRSPRPANVLGNGTIHDVALNPVGNPIYWAFLPDSAFGATKAQLQILLNPVSQFFAGDSITINGVTISVSATPNARQITPGLASLKTEAIYQILSTDPTLKWKYDFTFNVGGLITMVAKKSGTPYDITATENSPSSTPVSFINTPGVNGDSNQGKENWKAYIRVFVDARINTRRSFCDSQSLPIQDATFVGELAANYAEFNFETNQIQPVAVDVAEILRPFLESAPPRFGFNAVLGVLEMPIALLRYALVYGQSYIPAGANAPQRFDIGEVGFDAATTYWACNSALVNEALPININSRFNSFWERPTLISGDFINYLTRQPNAKRTTLDAFEFLYWIHYKPGASRARLCLKYNFYYQDGTELLNQYATLTAQFAAAGTVYYAEVGYRQALSKFPNVEATKPLHSFGVVVHEFYTEPGIAFTRDITVEQVYELDCDRCDLFRKAQVLFENPLGGFDTLVCRGDYDKETAASGETFGFEPTWLTHNEANTGATTFDQLPSNLTSDAQTQEISSKYLGQRGNIRVKTTQTYTLRTGWLTRVEAEWLQNSLLVSKQYYLIAFDDPDGVGNPNYPLLRKCYVESNAMKIAQFDDQFQFEFKVVASMPQNSLDG